MAADTIGAVDDARERALNKYILDQILEAVASRAWMQLLARTAMQPNKFAWHQARDECTVLWSSRSEVGNFHRAVYYKSNIFGKARMPVFAPKLIYAAGAPPQCCIACCRIIQTDEPTDFASRQQPAH